MLSKYINSNCKKIVATTLALTLTFSAVTFTPYQYDSKILNANATGIEEGENDGLSKRYTQLFEISKQIASIEYKAREIADELEKAHNDYLQAFKEDNEDLKSELNQKIIKLNEENSELRKERYSLMSEADKLNTITSISYALEECKISISKNPSDINKINAAIVRLEEDLRNLINRTTLTEATKDAAHHIVDTITDNVKNSIDEINDKYLDDLVDPSDLFEKLVHNTCEIIQEKLMNVLYANIQAEKDEINKRIDQYNEKENLIEELTNQYAEKLNQLNNKRLQKSILESFQLDEKVINQLLDRLSFELNSKLESFQLDEKVINQLLDKLSIELNSNEVQDIADILNKEDIKLLDRLNLKLNSTKVQDVVNALNSKLKETRQDIENIKKLLVESESSEVQDIENLEKEIQGLEQEVTDIWDDIEILQNESDEAYEEAKTLLDKYIDSYTINK